MEIEHIPILLACAAASYLTGAIPWGFLVARMRGVNIFSVGSGNVGATNVFRSVGKPWGVLTFLLDMLKGFVPPFLYADIAFNHDPSASMQALILTCGIFAIVGHCWSVFLRFRGGKGVATSLGVAFGVAPAAAGIGFASWGVALVVSGYVSLASIVAAGALAASGWFLYREAGLFLPTVMTLLAALVIYRHKANVVRLFKGTEHRFKILRRKK